MNPSCLRLHSSYKTIPTHVVVGTWQSLQSSGPTSTFNCHPSSCTQARQLHQAQPSPANTALASQPKMDGGIHDLLVWNSHNKTVACSMLASNAYDVSSTFAEVGWWHWDQLPKSQVQKTGKKRSSGALQMPDTIAPRFYCGPLGCKLANKLNRCIFEVDVSYWNRRTMSMYHCLRIIYHCLRLCPMVLVTGFLPTQCMLPQAGEVTSQALSTSFRSLSVLINWVSFASCPWPEHAHFAAAASLRNRKDSCAWAESSTFRQLLNAFALVVSPISPSTMLLVWLCSHQQTPHNFPFWRPSRVVWGE